jgi:Uma2 family endonuclease
MSLATENRLSAESYLSGEEQAEFKHEFLAGEVWAMVGATDTHVTIAGNLFFLLKQILKGSPCRSYISDMKVQIEKSDAFFYPDVVVTCDERDLSNRLFKKHPLFIAEVLSPATEAFDRGAKFSHYRQLESLQCYWLVDPGKQAIDSFTRMDNGDWVLHSYSGPGTVAGIKALDVEFAISDIYDEVEWETP